MSNIFAIKDTESNLYFVGFGQFDKQLRKAKLYTSERYANEVINDKRFKDRNLTLVKVMISEEDEWNKAVLNCLGVVQGIKDAHNENHCFGDKTHEYNVGTIQDIILQLQGLLHE